MLHRLKSLEARYNELLSLLAREDVARDFNQYKSISQELSQLEPVVKAFQEYLRLEEKLREDREILKEGGDKELKELAEGEIKTLTFESESLEREIRSLLLKNDPDGRRDIIVEIRAGTGGEEAALFASELYRMYFRLAEKKLWKAELLNINNSDLKGIKEVVFSISGENVYARLQYESGVHRVQRVPQTEASGRIHTSTATVAVLPEVEEVDVKIDPKDLRIDVFAATGPGGQNVNRNYTAIRITHLPTNTVVSIQDEKSQHKNKTKALRILRSRLYEMEQKKRHEEIAEKRKSQVGSGERSEKIRTYNFTQNRVTDHRIGVSVFNIPSFLDGDMDEILDALSTHFETQRLEETLGREE